MLLEIPFGKMGFPQSVRIFRNFPIGKTHTICFFLNWIFLFFRVNGKHPCQSVPSVRAKSFSFPWDTTNKWVLDSPYLRFTRVSGIQGNPESRIDEHLSQELASNPWHWDLEFRRRIHIKNKFAIHIQNTFGMDIHISQLGFEFVIHIPGIWNSAASIPRLVTDYLKVMLPRTSFNDDFRAT
jgi:hypothetical protein